MKFQPDFLPGVNTVSRWESGRIWVGADEHRESVLVPWRGAVQTWIPKNKGELAPEHFESLLKFEPEVVIFGSGRSFWMLSPSLYRSLVARQTGVESMDTAAACRTFNVLAQEGRKVVAALLLSD